MCEDEYNLTSENIVSSRSLEEFMDCKVGTLNVFSDLRKLTEIMLRKQ